MADYKNVSKLNSIDLSSPHIPTSVSLLKQVSLSLSLWASVVYAGEVKEFVFFFVFVCVCVFTHLYVKWLVHPEEV